MGTPFKSSAPIAQQSRIRTARLATISRKSRHWFQTSFSGPSPPTILSPDNVPPTSIKELAIILPAAQRLVRLLLRRRRPERRLQSLKHAHWIFSVPSLTPFKVVAVDNTSRPLNSELPFLRS